MSHVGDLRRGEGIVDAPGTERYVLTLFVSGASDSSAHAIASVREFCDTHLPGQHHVSIVDLNQEPALAEKHHVLATPALVRDQPLPTRVLVGDMSDPARILDVLDLRLAVRGPAGTADGVEQQTGP